MLNTACLCWRWVNLFIYILLINVLGFGVMWLDKAMAKAGKYKYRVPESRIFLIALAGGALGVFIGMDLFKHKTKKLKFTIIIPAIIILQLIVLRMLL
ncbi:MAG: DUF1294 domain-containing protein [Peptococcaceae bacterium MAG4]|nr:DUF1294 domain-containing protein [Peptococcaceae bacterium MAG4]